MAAPLFCDIFKLIHFRIINVGNNDDNGVSIHVEGNSAAAAAAAIVS